MSARRGHGEGSIYQRESDGLWCTSVDLGHVNGKRKRKVIYGKTRKEVAEKLKVVLHDQQQGLPVIVERQTVRQFLTQWLTDIVEPNHRAKTYRIYEQLTRTHLIPNLGHHQLTKLSPQHVQSLLNTKRDEGLSITTIQHIRAVLRNALNTAVKWGLVQRNVAALVDPPPTRRVELKPLTPYQARKLLEVARGNRLESLYRVALSVGLRQGEALGLRWADIDLEACTLRVSGALQAVDGKLTLVEPKTERSRRTLPLPSTLATALRAHRAQQLEDRLLAGARWQELGLVFATRRGTPIHPRNLVRDFKKLLRKAELPDIRFHDLRHSCNSLLAAQGVDARMRMEILGHSDIRTTQMIYTHVYDEGKRHAADVMDLLLGEAG